VTIVARVRRTIRERALLLPGARVLIACSGGPDSAALLFALARLAAPLRLQLEAASVDHGLRASAADDVAIAAAQAAAVAVPFHALQVRVERAGSLQAAARRARYQALHALGRRVGASAIAVGHTRDDQAETVLARLLRGASVLGLSGIAPRRADGVIRPLIDCDRAEVRAFAERHAPRVARDASNADPRFQRVRLRSRIMPALMAENVDLVARLCALADDARALRGALGPATEALLERSSKAGGIIDVSSWRAEPEAIRRLALRASLEPRVGAPLSRAHLTQLDAAIASGAPAEVWLPRDVSAVLKRDGTLRLGRSPRTRRVAKTP
jgi:tRNA(Ile)-lysidine synthase